MKTGLSVLQGVKGTAAAKKLIEADSRNSIRLLFPSLDFGYSYDPADNQSKNKLNDYFDSGTEKLIMDNRGYPAAG